METVCVDDDAAVSTEPTAPLAGAEAVPNGDVYELNLATTKALGALDGPLRDALGSEERGSMELRPLEHLNASTVALGSVQNDWPFAKISINLESISARFEGILRLIYLEYHLREPGLARKAMHSASFQVFTQFIRLLTLL